MSSSADHWPVAHLPTDLLQSPLTATLLTSILAAVLGSLQIGYHTGNVNAPAKVRDTDGESCGHRRWRQQCRGELSVGLGGLQSISHCLNKRLNKLCEQLQDLLPSASTEEHLHSRHARNSNSQQFTGKIFNAKNAVNQRSSDPWCSWLELPVLLALEPLSCTCTVQIIEEFFNQTWRARHNESMPDHSLTLLWSLSVSIKDFGALLGSLGVKHLADSYGRCGNISAPLAYSFLKV